MQVEPLEHKIQGTDKIVHLSEFHVIRPIRSSAYVLGASKGHWLHSCILLVSFLQIHIFDLNVNKYEPLCIQSGTYVRTFVLSVWIDVCT